MAFSTIAQVESALAQSFANGQNGGGNTLLNKYSVTTVAGFWYSLWLAGGQPGAGAAPTTWASPSQATAGAWNYGYINPPGSQVPAVLFSDLISGTSMGNVMCDRVGHMAGLSGTVTTAQTTGASLTAPAASGRCAANGSDVIWALEWYTATGTTACTATISYTNQAGTSGQTTTVALPASVPGSRIYPINVLAGTDTSIKSVDSVTLSISTGTAGNFGVTAFKPLFNFALPNYNTNDTRDWALLGMPQIGSNACFCPIQWPTTSNSGVIAGQIAVGAN